MPFELFIAIRYLREARFQTFLILAAVTVGVSVVVFLSALINGLQDNLLATTLGSQPHIIVTRVDSAPRVQKDQDKTVLDLVERPPARELIIYDWAAIEKKVRSLSTVTAATALASGPALATRGAASKSVALRGIMGDEYNRIVPISTKLKKGKFLLTGEKSLIGIELARDLGISIGEKFRIEASNGRSAILSVSGIFDLGSKDVNRRWVLTNLRLAQTLLDMPGGATSLEIRVVDIFQADEIALKIAERTGLLADSWMKLNQQLMTGLKSQSSSRYVIEFFVIIAVALGIASVLLVAVVQKSKEIGIMRAFGTSDKQVLKVFLLQGTILGCLGSIGGCIMGGILAFMFRSLVKNPDGGPLFPIALTPSLLASTTVMAIIVGLLAAVFPAWRATQLDPAEVIRYG